MEWNRVNTAELIEIYHNSPELWNNSLPSYKDYRLRCAKMTEIACHFNCSLKCLRDKVRNLRTAFHRERKRLRTKKIKESTWAFYKPLSFLLDVTADKSVNGSDSEVSVLLIPEKEH